MNTYDTKLVKDQARGNWDAIFTSLAPELGDALAKKGKHVTCPYHGGKSDFRIDKKSNEGRCFCTCKGFRDGFSLISHSRNCSYIDAVNIVGEHLNLEPWKPRVLPKVQRKSQPTETVPIEVYEPHVSVQKVTSSAQKLLRTLKSKPEIVPKSQDIQKTSDEPSAISKSSIKMTKKEALTSSPNKDPWIIKAMRDEFNNAIPLSDNKSYPVRHYLSKRAISLRLLIGLEDIRYSSSSRYYYDPDVETVPKKLRDQEKPFQEMPAMVAAFRNPKGEIVNVHRTYLTPKSGQKAKVKTPKKYWPSSEQYPRNGGAIRLGEPSDGIMGIAEGIETALSCYQAWGIPCWSTGDANGMVAFNPPEGTKLVFIWADKDMSKTGILAAQKLERRLKDMNIPVVILQPSGPVSRKRKTVDWNDVHLSHGLFGFPYKQSILSNFSVETSNSTIEEKKSA